MIRRQHNDEKRSGQLRRLGEVVDGLVDDLRFHCQVETLQNLGPRAVGEFLVGISEQRVGAENDQVRLLAWRNGSFPILLEILIRSRTRRRLQGLQWR